MKSFMRPASPIRRFIVVWAGAILLAFALLCGGLVYSISKLHSKTSRIFFDSQSLQTNHLFEAAVLDEGRQDLLWRATRKSIYRQARQRARREATAQLQELVSQADSSHEARLASRVAEKFHALQRAGPRDAVASQAALDELLRATHLHREFNGAQMNATVRTSNRLDRAVDWYALILICGATVLVVVGGVELWSRIFKPALQISQAAREFGDGQLQTRAPVFRDDEMGALAATFNVMAEAICLREKERLEFVATLAHDLKTPLVVIGGAAHLLKDKDYRFTPEEKQEWLGRILGQTVRLEGMIADLTDGVQSQTGQLTLQRREFDFVPVVREAMAQLSAATQSHRIEYSGAASCSIHGDPKRLERVVANLLSNAVKYSARDSNVVVSLEARGGCGVLVVRDEGAGIAEADLPKLFLPFSRLDHTRHMAKGTGLGLSSVKKIVEAHGGVIKVQSHLGVGTTVEVSLPLNAPVVELPA